MRSTIRRKRFIYSSRATWKNGIVFCQLARTGKVKRLLPNGWSVETFIWMDRYPQYQNRWSVSHWQTQGSGGSKPMSNKRVFFATIWWAYVDWIKLWWSCAIQQLTGNGLRGDVYQTPCNSPFVTLYVQSVIIREEASRGTLSSLTRVSPISGISAQHPWKLIKWRK